MTKFTPEQQIAYLMETEELCERLQLEWYRKWSEYGIKEAERVFSDPNSTEKQRDHAKSVAYFYYNRYRKEYCRINGPHEDEEEVIISGIENPCRELVTVEQTDGEDHEDYQPQ